MSRTVRQVRRVRRKERKWYWYDDKGFIKHETYADIQTQQKRYGVLFCGPFRTVDELIVHRVSDVLYSGLEYKLDERMKYILDTGEDQNDSGEPYVSEGSRKEDH